MKVLGAQEGGASDILCIFAGFNATLSKSSLITLSLTRIPDIFRYEEKHVSDWLAGMGFPS